ncbi:MAG TPA: hypothetical protein VLH56_11230 [Dissulfurispiraceae bacterium]|nr:hypothetical protein [Dissulfurispiraceae bacterium]
MSNEKFTPGPWKVSNYRPYDIIARDPKESTYDVGDDKFAPIAVVNRYGLSNQQEFFKNSHLISAAPEMYEAIKTLCANNIENLNCPASDCEVCFVKKIMKKARGEL